MGRPRHSDRGSGPRPVPVVSTSMARACLVGMNESFRGRGPGRSRGQGGRVGARWRRGEERMEDGRAGRGTRGMAPGGCPGWSTWHGGLGDREALGHPVAGDHVFCLPACLFGGYVVHPQPHAAVVSRDSVSGSGHSASGALLRSLQIPVAARPQKRADEASLGPRHQSGNRSRRWRDGCCDHCHLHWNRILLHW